MKKVRTIRIDKEVSDKLDSICNRHGDVSWHIEQALNGYGPIKGLTVPEPIAKPKTKESTTGKTSDIECLAWCFDEFWKSGIRKVNKKNTKPLFAKVLNTYTHDNLTPYDLTSRLVNDIKKRLVSNQLGFAEMHPTTYLNGERWNDEVTPNGQNQSGRNAPANRKLTPVERVRAKRREAEARDNGGVGILGDDGNPLPLRMDEQRGGRADRALDEPIEGTYTRSD